MLLATPGIPVGLARYVEFSRLQHVRLQSIPPPGENRMHSLKIRIELKGNEHIISPTEMVLTMRRSVLLVQLNQSLLSDLKVLTTAGD